MGIRFLPKISHLQGNSQQGNPQGNSLHKAIPYLIFSAKSAIIVIEQKNTHEHVNTYGNRPDHTKTYV